MVTYQKSDADIKILYQVEYLMNYDESTDSIEDQTRVKKFDSLDDALMFYLVQFFRMCSYGHDDHDRISDVKLLSRLLSTMKLCGKAGLSRHLQHFIVFDKLSRMTR